MPYHNSDSDNSSSSRYKKKKKTRSRSSSSSSDDRSSHRHSKKSTRHRRHRSRSRSNSPAHYSSRRRRSRSTSYHRRSRSRSLSPRRRPRSRSPKYRSHKSHSASGSRRQSRSLSGSPRRRSNSPSSKSSKHSSTDSFPKNISDSDRLKMKIQQVIKAAANANAELREKGLLSEDAARAKLAAPSVSEQIERAKIIDEINAPSFSQQAFVSRRKDEKKDSNKEVDEHTAAIFGSFESLVSATKEVVPLCNWREKPELLVHENLLESQEIKIERWCKKLAAERRKRVNGVALGHMARADL
uniref:Putative transcriptional coactivator caper rrm superfamily protein n=1 Tax=Ornithodoros turicata TaxID=34597 RepID=A0A2R5LE72_9ACAR